jgi:uncharacterized protein with HEPN domain
MGINAEIVWDVVKTKLPALKNQIMKFLSDLE